MIIDFQFCHIAPLFSLYFCSFFVIYTPLEIYSAALCETEYVVTK